MHTKEPGGELSEKSNVGKQTIKSQKSSIARFTHVDTVKHLEPGLNKSIDAQVKVPKGVQFLSFGAERKQENHSDARPTTKPNTHLMEQNLMIVLNKDRENSASQAAETSASGEVSEAQFFLQVFLFGFVCLNLAPGQNCPIFWMVKIMMAATVKPSCYFRVTLFSWISIMQFNFIIKLGSCLNNF
jgi:hypothetical protein